MTINHEFFCRTSLQRFIQQCDNLKDLNKPNVLHFDPKRGFITRPMYGCCWTFWCTADSTDLKVNSVATAVLRFLQNNQEHFSKENISIFKRLICCQGITQDTRLKFIELYDSVKESMIQAEKKALEESIARHQTEMKERQQVLREKDTLILCDGGTLLAESSQIIKFCKILTQQLEFSKRANAKLTSTTVTTSTTAVESELKASSATSLSSTEVELKSDSEQEEKFNKETNYAYKLNLSQFKLPIVSFFLQCLDDPQKCKYRSLHHSKDLRFLLQVYMLCHFAESEKAKEIVAGMIGQLWSLDQVMHFLSTCTYECDDTLVRIAYILFISSFDEAIEHSLFVKMRSEYLIDLLSFSPLGTLYEYDIIKAVFKWVKGNLKEGESVDDVLEKRNPEGSCLLDFLYPIRCGVSRKEHLTQDFLDENLQRTSSEAYKKFRAALRYQGEHRGLKRNFRNMDRYPQVKVLNNGFEVTFQIYHWRAFIGSFYDYFDRNNSIHIGVGWVMLNQNINISLIKDPERFVNDDLRSPFSLEFNSDGNLGLYDIACQTNDALTTSLSTNLNRSHRTLELGFIDKAVKDNKLQFTLKFTQVGTKESKTEVQDVSKSLSLEVQKHDEHKASSLDDETISQNNDSQSLSLGGQTKYTERKREVKADG